MKEQRMDTKETKDEIVIQNIYLVKEYDTDGAQIQSPTTTTTIIIYKIINSTILHNG